MKNLIKNLIRAITPPVILKAFKSNTHQNKPVLQYSPGGWPSICSESGTWDNSSILQQERERWNNFISNAKAPNALGFSHEHSDPQFRDDVSFHNVYMIWGYVLGLASRQKSCISILDWGGGLGHYFLIAKSLFPDLQWNYSIKEMPSIAEEGKSLIPEVTWYADESCLAHQYDLVFVNGSLQYSKDWEETLRKLSHSAREYLLLIRIPVVQSHSSFVAIQRYYPGTAIPHWQFNERELLNVAKSGKLDLQRELLIGDRPFIESAPEQCCLKGWLFTKK